ncbi:class I SAM-dependent methyltransferase [Variovorax sp. dw_954]|uniref:class I SAM-dependent methyltransferase n=1 Tax=Variovorax sp. dw_954 TaxID=2720078 RepID=UPI001BD4E4DA|nr:class I SAM-dependent methyltransferase [Variovorax sp. dw_954]
MNPADPSRTALATSMMRAVHSRTAPRPVIDDPWGDRLVPDSVRAAALQTVLARMDSEARAKALQAPEAVLDAALRANAAHADVIVRTRYAEDALAAAAQRGIDQYVMVGAGFDSFALRQPPYAEAMTIFEIDHPATQGMKRRRLDECGVHVPDNLHFIAADLASEGLDAALARSSFQPGRPTFFSWLGVTMYLTREANLATLRAIASCAAPGSELVFSYVDNAVFTPGHARSEAFRQLQASVASAGEAFLSGFDPTTLEETLRETGFLLLEDSSGNETVARYDETGINGLRSSAAAHLAHVRVVGEARQHNAP